MAETITYKGARYVPIFADPVEWSNERFYEYMTIVNYQGNSYISLKDVPVGTDIANTEYWILMANYSSQIDNVQRQVTQNASDIATAEQNIQKNADDITAANASIQKNAEDITAANASIQKNAEDIAAANTSIQKNAEDITAANASIQKNAEDIVDISTSMFSGRVDGKNIVFFGDSFMQENIPNSINAYLPNQIATKLNGVKKNFAIAGAGFARTGNIITSQIQTARDTMSEEDKKNTALIIIYAGFNDFNNNMPSADITNGMVNACAMCAEVFPNAKIVMVPFNWGYGHLPTATSVIMDTIEYNVKRATNAYPVQWVENARWWCIGNAASFQNSVHPSEIGYNMISSQIVSGVLGGNTDAVIGATLTSVFHGNVDTPFTWSFKNGLYQISGAIHFSDTLSNYVDTLFNANAYSIFDKDEIVPMYSTTGDTVSGKLIYRTTGNVQFYTKSYTENTVLLFTSQPIPVNVNIDWSN